MNKLLRRVDIDLLLVFFLLAVTVSQLGHYLASFAAPGWEFLGYLQAIGIDAAIWRSAYWFRTYHGRHQKRLALGGMILFSLISVWYNAEYYMMRTESNAGWLRAISMGAVLPIGVAALSYLHGVKDASAFATGKETRPAAKEQSLPVAEPAPAATAGAHEQDHGSLSCARSPRCSRNFSWPDPYKDRKAAINARNAHHCSLASGNGNGQEERMFAQ